MTGHHGLIPTVELPDPDDRHVLAAALHAGARIIVTSNLRDFPASTLESLGVEAQSPDDFVCNLLEWTHPRRIVGVLIAQSAPLHNPPLTPAEIVDRLERGRLERAAPRLREMLDGRW